MLGKSKCLSNHSSHSSHWTWPDNGYLSHFSHNSQVIKKQRTLLKVHLHGLPKEMEHILMFYSLIFRFPTFPTHLGVENPNLSFDKVTVQKPAVPSWRVNKRARASSIAQQTRWVQAGCNCHTKIIVQCCSFIPPTYGVIVWSALSFIAFDPSPCCFKFTTSKT